MGKKKMREKSTKGASKGFIHSVNTLKCDAHKVNEDQVLVRPLHSSSNSDGSHNPDTTIAVVLDGHGGDRCSSWLVNELYYAVKNHPYWEQFEGKGVEEDRLLGVYNVLHECFQHCDDKFTKLAKAENETSGSCCLCCVILNGCDCYFANVGDCRAIVGNMNNAICKPITVDHRASFGAEKQRVLAAGGQIQNGMVNGVLAPSRSFGDIDVKRGSGKNVVITTPDTFYLQAVAGQFLVLGSDGLFDGLSNAEIGECVRSSLSKNNFDVQETSDQLMHLAKSRNFDDISVIVFYFK